MHHGEKWINKGRVFGESHKKQAVSIIKFLGELKHMTIVIPTGTIGEQGLCVIIMQMKEEEQKEAKKIV